MLTERWSWWSFRPLVLFLINLPKIQSSIFHYFRDLSWTNKSCWSFKKRSLSTVFLSSHTFPISSSSSAPDVSWVSSSESSHQQRLPSCWTRPCRYITWLIRYCQCYLPETSQPNWTLGNRPGLFSATFHGGLPTFTKKIVILVAFSKVLVGFSKVLGGFLKVLGGFLKVLGVFSKVLGGFSKDLGVFSKLFFVLFFKPTFTKKS